jgi:hypothetical protein
MAEKTYKCPFCRQQVGANESILVRKRHYHPSCLQQEQDEKKTKQELKDEIRSAANNDPNYKKLVEYICELYELDHISPMIISQIDKYHERYNLKYTGIQLSLQYYYETLKNPIKEQYGIGIVPSIYDKTKYFYLQQKKVAASVKSDTIETERQVIDVNVKPTSKRNKMIDISKIK